MASTHAQWPSWNSPLGDNRPHFLHPNDFQFAGFLRVGVPVGTDNGVVWWNEGGGGRREATPCSYYLLFSSTHLYTRLVRLPQSQVCTCRRTRREDCSTQRCPRTCEPAPGFGTRRYLERNNVIECLYVMLYHPSRKYAPLPNYAICHKSRINAAFRLYLTIRSHLVEDIVHLLQDAVNTWK